MAVAPCRRGRGGTTRYRARAWRHDDTRLGMVRDDLGVDVVAIERAGGGERGHRPVDPVEQGTGLGAVIGIMVGQRRRDDPPGVGVRGKIKLLPSPTPPGAVLLD